MRTLQPRFRSPFRKPSSRVSWADSQWPLGSPLLLRKHPGFPRRSISFTPRKLLRSPLPLFPHLSYNGQLQTEEHVLAALNPLLSLKILCSFWIRGYASTSRPWTAYTRCSQHYFIVFAFPVHRCIRPHMLWNTLHVSDRTYRPPGPSVEYKMYT